MSSMATFELAIYGALVVAAVEGETSENSEADRRLQQANTVVKSFTWVHRSCQRGDRSNDRIGGTR